MKVKTNVKAGRRGRGADDAAGHVRKGRRAHHGANHA